MLKKRTPTKSRQSSAISGVNLGHVSVGPLEFPLSHSISSAQRDFACEGTQATLSVGCIHSADVTLQWLSQKALTEIALSGFNSADHG